MTCKTPFLFKDYMIFCNKNINTPSRSTADMNMAQYKQYASEELPKLSSAEEHVKLFFVFRETWSRFAGTDNYWLKQSVICRNHSRQAKVMVLRWVVVKFEVPNIRVHERRESNVCSLHSCGMWIWFCVQSMQLKLTFFRVTQKRSVVEKYLSISSRSTSITLNVFQYDKHSTKYKRSCNTEQFY
jgi:hypothetical protein